MVISLDGIWDRGYAFDFHTMTSTYLGTDTFGHDRFQTTRTPMGELVYQLKYNGDRLAAVEIVKLLATMTGFQKFHAIIPCPATKKQSLAAS